MDGVNIYACEEHLDDAFDNFIDEKESFPNLDKTCEDKEKCSFCMENAKYKLSMNIEEKKEN